MKKTVLRVLSLALALLMASAMLFACGTDEGGNVTNNGAATQQGEETPVPHLNWNGRPFRVLTTNNAYEPNFEVIGEMGADKLSQKVYERNLYVQEFCNVEIFDASNGSTDNFGALEMDFMSGTMSYDLAFLLRDEMSNAIQRGFMKDITKVEYVNLENEWYNSVAIDTMKISDRLYHLSSSYSLTDKARTSTLYFNRDMATELGVEIDVIEEIRAGTWTVEKMYQIVSMVAANGDGNGDGAVQNTDTFGLVGGGDECATAFYLGMGNKLVDLDNAQGDYGHMIIEDTSLIALDKIKAMLDVKGWMGFTGSESVYWKQNYDLPYETFVDERAMFYSASMGVIEDLAADADFAYTAITFPKYDTDQDRYYTTNDNHYTSTFGIPFMAYDVDFSGYMIEVLSWKSHTTTYPEYYQVKCLVQKSYDPVCAEMLQRNYEGLVFDVALMFSQTIKYKAAMVTYATSAKNTKNMATLYAETESAANNAIQGIIDIVGQLPD